MIVIQLFYSVIIISFLKSVLVKLTCNCTKKRAFKVSLFMKFCFVLAGFSSEENIQLPGHESLFKMCNSLIILHIFQVNDPPVRNSQEAFMMEMRAARMVKAYSDF